MRIIHKTKVHIRIYTFVVFIIGYLQNFVTNFSKTSKYEF
jgi:hypothetical protein